MDRLFGVTRPCFPRQSGDNDRVLGQKGRVWQIQYNKLTPNSARKALLCSIFTKQ